MVAQLTERCLHCLAFVESYLCNLMLNVVRSLYLLNSLIDARCCYIDISLNRTTDVYFGVGATICMHQFLDLYMLVM